MLELAKVLLLDYFQLDVDLPAGKLVPRIPQRLNYILLIEDILAANHHLLSGKQITGIDIGMLKNPSHTTLKSRNKPAGLFRVRVYFGYFFKWCGFILEFWAISNEIRAQAHPILVAIRELYAPFCSSESDDLHIKRTTHVIVVEDDFSSISCTSNLG